MYYGADYYPEHWPESRWDQDAGMMQAAGFNVVRMAEFAWTRMEPREGEYNFAWLDRAIDLLSHYGIDAVLGTPTAAPPAWIMTAHPEATLVNEAQVPITYGSRRNYCPNNPIYRQHSARIVRAMAEHYAGNAHVIGWQIDNEFGGRCYCPVCQAAFQRWLEMRYGTLDALNAAWGTEFWSHIYTEWNQIPLPWAATGVHNPALALNYRRFMSDSYVDYQRAQIAILREVCPGAPITHNLMGFGYPNLNYFDLAKDLDWVSWDNYPRFRGQPDPAGRALAHATMRGLKGKPFWVMEEQGGPTGNATVALAPRPGEIPYWAWQAVAHGADGIVYFRWRTARFGAEEYWHGILDHHGIPGRRYDEVRAMGEIVKRIGTRLDGSQVTCQAAMLLSYDSRFALQNQPHNPHLDYPKVFAGLYRALWQRNIGVQVVAPEADLTEYPLVVAPLLYILDEGLAARLTAYVADGGTLVLTCRTGVMDMDNMVVNERLPGLLRDLCGIVVDEYDSLEDGRSVPLAGAGVLEGVSGSASAWADVLSLQNADALAYYAGEYYATVPAVTLNKHGRGQVVYIGTVPDGSFAGALVAQLALMSGIFSTIEAEPGLEVVERVSAERRFLFLLNGNAEARTADVGNGGHELITEEDVTGRITVPPLGVRIIEQARI
jgi:beta-galactosidase